MLTAIDQRNKILQLKDQTIDIELENIKSLLSDLELLKTNWEAILTECKAVASVMEIDPVIGLSRIRSRKRKRFYDEDEQIAENNEDETGDETEPGLDKFRKDTFDVLLNEVINQIKTDLLLLKIWSKSLASFGSTDTWMIPSFGRKLGNLQTCTKLTFPLTS